MDKGKRDRLSAWKKKVSKKWVNKKGFLGQWSTATFTVDYNLCWTVDR
jgi:hypothetical protein